MLKYKQIENKFMEEQNSADNKKIDLDKKYQDQEGVSLKKLNLGLWFVEHRNGLKKSLVAALSLVAAVSWLFTLYNFGDYFIFGLEEDEEIGRELARSQVAGHDFVSGLAPRGLEITASRIFKNEAKDESRYDFLAQATNPNADYWAEFDYYFFSAGRRLAQNSGFILPGEKKYLVSLAERLDFRPGSAELRIENLKWRRINKHEISDWEAYRHDRLNIEGRDAQFISSQASELSDKLNVNRLLFNAFNMTPFNYWQADFIIVLHSGSSPAAVSRYSIPEFMSNSAKKVEISWPGIIPKITKIEIIPDINIMKSGIYIKYEGGAGGSK